MKKELKSAIHSSVYPFLKGSFRVVVSALMILSLVMASAPIAAFRGLFITDVAAVESALTLTNVEIINDKAEFVPGDVVEIVFTFNEPLPEGCNGSVSTKSDFPDIERIDVAKGYEMAFIGNNQAKIEITIENDNPSGIYELYNVEIKHHDYAQPILTVYNYASGTGNFNMAGGTFKVGQTTVDQDAPVLDAVVTDKTIAVKDDVVKLTLAITEASDNAYVSLYLLEGVSQKISSSLVGCGNYFNDQVVCEVNISEFTSLGLWQIDHIVLQDFTYLNNTVTIYNEKLYADETDKMNFDVAEFTVEGTIFDETGPTFNSLTLSSNVFPVNVPFAISIDAEDDKAGFAYAYVWMVNVDTQISHFVSISGSEIRTVNLNAASDVGTWVVKRITAYDYAVNSSIYYNQDYLYDIPSETESSHIIDMSAYGFTATAAEFDDMTGYFTGFDVNFKEAKPGDELLFTVETGPAMASVERMTVKYAVHSMLMADGPGYEPTAILINDGTGTFTGSMDSTLFNFSSGNYEVMQVDFEMNGQAVTIYDSRTPYGRKVVDFSGLDFAVIEDIGSVDPTPPILDSITIDKHAATVDEKVNIDVKAHDDESEIGRVVVLFRVDGIYYEDCIEYWSYGETNGFQEFYGKWVSLYDRPGVWEIDQLRIESLTSYVILYNSKFYPNAEGAIDLTDIYFTITGTTLDKTDPTLTSIQTSSTQGNPNNSVVFTANMSDNLAGIAFAQVQLIGPNGQSEYVEIYPDDSISGSGTFNILPNIQSGLWKIDCVSLFDNARNFVFYYNSKGYVEHREYEGILTDFSSSDITITGTIEDSAAPAFESVTTDFDSYITSSFANVTVNISEINGVKDAILTYLTPGGFKKFNYGFGYDSNHSLSFGISIPSYKSVGLWRLTSIEMKDYSGNKVVYNHNEVENETFHQRNLSGGNFTVFGNDSVPNIESYMISTHNAKSNDQVFVTMDMKDNIVKPETVDVIYQSTQSSSYRTIILHKNVDGIYEGSFFISQYESEVNWTVSYVSFTDRYGQEYAVVNSVVDPNAELTQDLSSGDFAVSGTTPDLSAPELNGADIEKIAGESINAMRLSIVDDKVFTTNDTLKFIVDASDDVSGVDTLKVTYEIYKKKMNFVVALTQNTDGKYEGEVNIEDYFPSGSWILTYFELIDSAGNSYIQQRKTGETQGSITGLNQLQFMVQGTHEDLIDPTYANLELSSHLVKNGETLVFTATATDENSGVVRFVINVASQFYGVEKAVEMILQSDRSYRGELAINENLAGGPWAIATINITDRAANTNTIYNTFMTMEFRESKVDLSMHNFSITSLKSAVIQKLPAKLTYKVGETLDLGGLEVLGTYTDDTTGLLTSYDDQVFGFDSSKTDETQTVYVQYNDQYVTFEVTIVAASAPIVGVRYRTHVQNFGWQEFVADGAVSGTANQALRLEAINIEIIGGANLGITYTAHVQNIGWQDYVSDGAMSGTTDKALRLEAIRIALTGSDAVNYDIYYRAHVQNYGWLDWAKNGRSAGTEGFGLRLEAINIIIVPKGTDPDLVTTRPFVSTNGAATINYRTHVQNVGWQGFVGDGATSGTTGNSLRLEGIEIRLGSDLPSGSVTYATHVQDFGWMSSVSNGIMSGTAGQSKRLEAIRISLSGSVADVYDIYYRVHAQNFGWMDWAKNGESAGTTNYAYRLEGIEIILVLKGADAPGSTARPFVQK